MDINKLLTEFNLTTYQIKEISSKLVPISLKKGETFIKQGEKTHRLGILLNGLLYSTYISEDGSEWVSRFFFLPDNFIVSNHESFFFKRNSTETITAYEETQLLSISKENLDKLMDNHLPLERIVRILAEESYIQAMNRIHMLQSLNAEKRVKKFMKDHPDLVNRIQRQHFASYIGINRNLLTKILSRI